MIFYNKKAVGKKYQVSASKFLKKIATTEEEEKINNRTFFCSELVAASYKRLGILPKNVSASQYFPGTFSALRNLKLLDQTRLCREFMIDFSIP